MFIVVNDKVILGSGEWCNKYWQFCIQQLLFNYKIRLFSTHKRSDFTKYKRIQQLDKDETDVTENYK